MMIRQQQLRALQPLADAAMVRSIARHIIGNHGTSTVRCPSGVFRIAEIPNSMLDELIHSGITMARHYGLSWESSLTAFVTLMFVVAPNFHDFPSVQRILLDPSTPPDSRLAELWDGTAEEEWEQMKERYDPDAWRPRPAGGVIA
jgi:hypothetical protein